MVLGRKEVAVDFITKLKDKGFKDLDKSTKKSIKSLQKLGKVLGATLTVTAFVAFVKASTKQFAELEKNTKRLESELNNLGIAFATSLGTDFTRNLALASGISQDKLLPALQKLVQTTYTLTDAQKLLSLSLEISKRKGIELENVTNAISRAFVGDFKALVKLRIGFETAELAGKDFQDVLKALTAEFGVKQADNFATKIEQLKVAFEETQVAIGKGFVEGLEDAGLSIEQTQQKMIELGEKIGKALGKGAAAILDIQKKLEDLAKNPLIRFLLDALDALVGLDPFGPAARAAEKETEARVRAADAYAKQLDTQGKLVKLAEAEAALAKQRAADLAKLKRQERARAAEKKRSAEIERLRNAINFKFDIDAINQQAALRRNLSQSDRDRVLQLSALKIADYQTDEDAIKTLEAATQGRYDSAMNLEKMLQLLTAAGFATSKAAIDTLAALKPQMTFTDNLDNVAARLKALIEGKYNININASLDGKSTFIPGAVTPSTVTPGPYPASPRIGEGPGKPYLQNLTPELQDQLVDIGINAKTLFELQLGAEGDYANLPNFGRPTSSPVMVNVNVSGSVIAQNDLVAAVTDAVYATQRTGNTLLLTE